MKKLFLFLFATCFLALSAYADRTISGRVLDSASDEPLIGATIQPVGSTNGTATDFDGAFTIVVPDHVKTLNVSYVGYESLQVSVQNSMIIRLKANDQTLSEVVVTGYGTVKRAAFTGAASTLDGSVLEKKADVNFVKALEGSVTGVQMNNSTSMPGTWSSIYVRGRGSLNSGTQPLYVIDGIPVNSDADAMSSTYNNQIDPMASINPNDIENVTVLKDAAATAIYGSRAGNGVIVITTKQGKQGKHNINLDIKQGFVTVGNNNMKFADAEQTLRLTARGYADRYKDGTADEYYDLLIDAYCPEWDHKTSYDWIDKVTRKGYYQDYNLSVSGQTGTTSYYVSGGFLSSEGLVIGSDFKRYSGRANINSKFKMFTFGTTASYAYAVKNGFSQSTSGSMSSPIVAAVSSMRPYYPFYNEDGTYANVDLYNPLALQDSKLGDMNENKTTTINLTPYLRVDFGKGIYFKTTLGVNIYGLRQYDYWSAVYNPQGMDYPGLGQQYNSETKTITWTNLLGWNYTFNELHNLGLMLGQESVRKDYWYDYYSGYDFPYADSGMRDMSTCGAWNDSEYYKSEARIASYFLDAHYDFENRYYASFAFRHDGSSVFGADKRWGNFWSVGAKWRFTAEPFWKENKVLTNGMLRVSYGTVGNQDIGWYASRGFYVAGSNYHGTSGMIPGSISNRNLTWETSKKFDVGVDLSFINRIHLTLDYYNETTSDALMEVPLSRTTGMTSVMQNIGKIRNSGIEVGINAGIISNQDINWTAYFNMTYNKNKVLELATDEPLEGTWSIVKPGYPYNQFYMKEWAGVNPENGLPLWYLNEEGDETTSDYNAAAKRFVGSAEPKFLGGFGTQFRWKGLDASVAFNYRMGGKVFDTGAKFTGWGMAGRTPLETVVENSWTPENPHAKYPQFLYGDPYKSTERSTRFLMSGNYLKLSNIQIGYTLPSNWTTKAFMEKVRIYLSADNLYTWTAKDFVGYNPETFASGQIAWQYPANTTLMAGLQVTF